MTFLLSDITIRSVAASSGPDGGWEIVFTSPHDGLHHQLSADGELADFTETPTQRHFRIEGSPAPRQFVIGAVDAEHRLANLSALLPAELRCPAWVYHARIVPPPPGTACRLELLGDHATGQMDPLPLATLTLETDSLPRWGFGRGRFGQEAMGHDLVDAPGLGGGAFGAGMLGADAELLSLTAALPEEGTHQLLLRTVAGDGSFADGQLMHVESHPPPQPLASITAVSYDDGKLTLALSA